MKIYLTSLLFPVLLFFPFSANAWWLSDTLLKYTKYKWQPISEGGSPTKKQPAGTLQRESIPKAQVGNVYLGPSAVEGESGPVDIIHQITCTNVSDNQFYAIMQHSEGMVDADFPSTGKVGWSPGGAEFEFRVRLGFTPQALSSLPDRIWQRINEGSLNLGIEFFIIDREDTGAGDHKIVTKLPGTPTVKGLQTRCYKPLWVRYISKDATGSFVIHSRIKKEEAYFTKGSGENTIENPLACEEYWQVGKVVNAFFRLGVLARHPELGSEIYYEFNCKVPVT